MWDPLRERGGERKKSGLIGAAKKVGDTLLLLLLHFGPLGGIGDRMDGCLESGRTAQPAGRERSVPLYLSTRVYATHQGHYLYSKAFLKAEQFKIGYMLPENVVQKRE